MTYHLIALWNCLDSFLVAVFANVVDLDKLKVFIDKASFLVSVYILAVDAMCWRKWEQSAMP